MSFFKTIESLAQQVENKADSLGANFFKVLEHGVENVLTTNVPPLAPGSSTSATATTITGEKELNGSKEGDSSVTTNTITQPTSTEIPTTNRTNISPPKTNKKPKGAEDFLSSFLPSIPTLPKNENIVASSSKGITNFFSKVVETLSEDPGLGGGAVGADPGYFDGNVWMPANFGKKRDDGNGEKDIQQDRDQKEVVVVDKERVDTKETVPAQSTGETDLGKNRVMDRLKGAVKKTGSSTKLDIEERKVEEKTEAEAVVEKPKEERADVNVVEAPTQSEKEEESKDAEVATEQTQTDTAAESDNTQESNVVEEREPELPSQSIAESESTQPIIPQETEPPKEEEEEEEVIVKDSDESAQVEESKPEPQQTTIPSPTDNTILSEREKQLVKSMQENARLNDSISTLQSQFTTTKQEYDNLKSRYDALLADKSSTKDGAAQLSQLQVALAEKEEECKGLLQEGQNLSKEVGKLSTKVKDQRAKIQELSSSITELTNKLESTTAELSDTKQRLTIAIESERKYQESLQALEKVSDNQNKSIIKLEQDLHTEQEKSKNLQSTLDRAWNELSDTKKQLAQESVAIESEALSKETNKNSELRDKVRMLEEEKESIEMALRKDIFDLRSTLSRVNEEAGWREDNFRKEIETLQLRLQESETRAQDVASTLQDSSKPLLRQIETLQQQYSVAVKNFEELERQWMERLRDMETKWAAAIEKENISEVKIGDLSQKLATTSQQLSTLQHDNVRLNTTNESLSTKANTLGLQITQLETQLATLKSNHSKQLQELKDSHTKTILETVEKEKQQWESAHAAEDQAKTARLKELESERERERLRHSILAQQRSEDIDSTSRSVSSPATGITPNPLFSPESSMSLNAAMMNNGNQVAQIRQLELQLSNLQAQLQLSNNTKDSLTDELVLLTKTNNDLVAQNTTLAESVNKSKEIETNYFAALELLGEQTELVQELRFDLKEAKEAYQEQLTGLLGKMEKMRKLLKDQGLEVDDI